MSETADLNTATDAAPSTHGALVRWLAPFAIAVPAAAVGWELTGEFRLDAGIGAAALVLLGWPGYVSAIAGLIIVAAMMAPSVTDAIVHVLATAIATTVTGLMLRRDLARQRDAGRTMHLVLGTAAGAAVAAIAMVPISDSISRTLSLWIGIWAGGLLSAALFLELARSPRNRQLVAALVVALVTATLLAFLLPVAMPGGALIASLGTLAVLPLTLEIGFGGDRLSRARESNAASEDARKRSDAHARAVIDTAVDAIAIIDANGIIMSFNRAASRMFGYDAREVIGSNVNMLMPEPHRTQHDGYLHRYITTAERRIIGIGRELDARRKDGTTVPIHLSVSETVLDNQRTFTGVMRDISVERADKEEIRRQNERLSVTVRNAPMGIVTYQFGETFASTNRAFETMIGYSNTELAEMEFVTLTHPDDQVELKRLTDDAYAGRVEQFSLQLRLLRKSGTPVHVVTHSAITHDQYGVPDLIVAQVEDLTAEMMAKEAERVHQDRLTHVARLSTLGEMTAAIAHEINQPLTAISMYAQSGVRMLDAGIPKPERLREALEKLSAQSLRAGAVIDRVQRLVRKQESKFETVRINDLIGDILRLAESDARVNDMQIAVDLARDVAEVNADPIQIQQVLLNLIRNAIDAMRSIDCRHGSVVTIRSRAVSGYRVEVSVVDSGTGIADDLAEGMFTPFSTTKANGMGMGLSICRSIIDAHGGQLSYRNNPDHGATFYFQLPIGNVHET